MDLKDLSKDNISVRQIEDVYILKSSFFRYSVIRDLLILPIIIFLSLVDDGTYLPFSLAFSAMFIYFFWDDIKSINNLELNTKAKTIRIKHTNFIHFMVLHKWDGYKKFYKFNEIKSFTVKENWSLNLYNRKYFIVINLNEGHNFILLDVPHEPHADAVVNFLNEFLKST